MEERREAVKLSHADSGTQRYSITLTSDLGGPVAWQRRSGLWMLSRLLSGSKEAEGGVGTTEYNWCVHIYRHN